MDIIKFLTTPLDTNTYLVVNGKRAFVVDPGGKADEIAEKARDLGVAIEAILITHAHFDHIAGVAELQNAVVAKNCGRIALENENNQINDNELDALERRNCGQNLFENENKQISNSELDALDRGNCGRTTLEKSELSALECGNCDRQAVVAPLIIMHKDEVKKVNSFSNIGFSLGIKVKPFTPDVLLAGGETLNVAGMSVNVIGTPGHSAGGVCYVVENKIFVGDTLFFLSYGRTDFPDGSEKQLKNSVLNKIFNLKGDFELLCGHGAATDLEFERKNNPIRVDL